MKKEDIEKYLLTNITCLDFLFTSAPASRSIFAMAIDPCWQATCRGDHPPYVHMDYVEVK
jgi:hypothetical protein